MTHPLVTQLRFTRQEFLRGLEGISAEDARRQIGSLNCVSWVVGHLASQENAYWVLIAQDQRLYPELHKLVGTGQPASTPPYIEMLAAWHEITAAADRFLDSLTIDKLQVAHAMARRTAPRKYRHDAFTQHLPLLVPYR